jgi:hypothetical protein
MICNVQIVVCIYKKTSYHYLSKTKDDTKLKKLQETAIDFS